MGEFAGAAQLGAFYALSGLAIVVIGTAEFRGKVGPGLSVLLAVVGAYFLYRLLTLHL